MTVGSKLQVTVGIDIAGMTALGFFAIRQLSVVNNQSTVITRDWLPGVERIAALKHEVIEYCMLHYRFIAAQGDESRAKVQTMLDAQHEHLTKRAKDYEVTIIGLALAWLVGRQISAAVSTVLRQARSVSDVCVKGLRTGLDAIARGDTSYHLEAKTKLINATASDEIGQIAQSVDEIIRSTQATLSSYSTTQDVIKALIEEARMMNAVATPIDEARTVLAQVAARDLTPRMHGAYLGDYEQLKTAINTAIENIADTLTQVQNAAEQVASAGTQISSASQSLAQGSSEQVATVIADIAASSVQQSDGVQQINAAVDQLNGTTQQVASNADESASTAEELSSQAAMMQSMVSQFRLEPSKAFRAAGRSVAPSRGTSRTSSARPSAPRALAASASRSSAFGAAVIPFDADDDVLSVF